MFKPRAEASATGIVKVEHEQQLWDTVQGKGDRQSFYLLEKYLPGDVFHVDSLVWDRKVIFSGVHRCGRPPFNVAHGGGIFTTSTVERGSADEKALIALNEQVLTRLGLARGTSHTEFIKHSVDGKFYLLETSARVGGAHIAEVLEASSGVNLWAEWANVELDALEGKPYALPPLRKEYAAVLMTLSKQEHPDLSAYSDPEVVFRAKESHHAGLVIRSPSHARVQELLQSYTERFMNDFYTSLPASDKPSH
jgi:biotin carboxylase